MLSDFDHDRCAVLIGQADGLLITAGAGMGVDSGLPDFRGREGFWRAYPALGRARIDFMDIATPQAFRDQPALAWGFYGHRLALYRRVTPHEGFRLLREIAAALEHGAFVFTSNVDGHFQKAGFAADRVHECHGSIHHLQCLDCCTDEYWSADAFIPQVDERRCLLTGELPRCPHCGGLARPNVLMFGDWEWLSGRSDRQAAALRRWLNTVRRPVVIEIGAGTAVPTVRRFGERLGVPLIRINVAEPAVARAQDIGVAAGARDTLRGIHAALRAQGLLPGASP